MMMKMRSSTMAVAALAVLAALLLSSSVHAQSNFNIGSLFENVNVGSSGGGSSPKSAQDCRAGFASLGGISNLQNDGGILSCASGYGGSCCSAVRRYLGPGSALDGCGCQPGLLDEALGSVPGFARPIVDGAINSCGIPTTKNGRCYALG